MLALVPATGEQLFGIALPGIGSLVYLRWPLQALKARLGIAKLIELYPETIHER